MFDPTKPVPYVLGYETSVVDLHYPKSGGVENWKHEFINCIPRLIAQTGNAFHNPIKEVPRGGDMITASAEALDDICLRFAQEVNYSPSGASLLDQASDMRRVLFGNPIMHPGASVANTVDALLYSTIDGVALYQGKFITSVGNDQPGEYFKQSFGDNIICAQGGRQTLCHVIPLEHDRIMITAPSREDPAEKYFNEGLSHEHIEQADLIIVGGYLHFIGALGRTFDYINLRTRERKERVDQVFTLATKRVAESLVFHHNSNARITIHGNAGEIRRFTNMDDQWRLPFNNAFIDPETGALLQGRDLEKAKKESVAYQNAKLAANRMTIEHIWNSISGNQSLRCVMTDGPNAAHSITSEGISMLPNKRIPMHENVSTVGAGDHHTAGDWIGFRLGMNELGRLTMGAAFARAVIKVPEARLNRDAKVTIAGRTFGGPIANLDRHVLESI